VPRPGVVIDRDGTVIDFHRDTEHGLVTPAFHPSQLRFLPGVLDGLRELASAGYPIAVATNQPGAAKGELPREAIERTNAALVDRLAAEGITIAHVATCMHHPEGGDRGDAALVGPCDCRKPRPGLLFEVARALDLDAARSWFVGDTPTDVQAARAAGFRSALVFPAGRCELCPLKDAPTLGSAPDLHGKRFDEVARSIVLSAPRDRE
jgi:D-glycero-D-manno-heptose 1,7-bisphosphate phosphatase